MWADGARNGVVVYYEQRELSDDLDMCLMLELMQPRAFKHF